MFNKLIDILGKIDKESEQLNSLADLQEIFHNIEKLHKYSVQTTQLKTILKVLSKIVHKINNLNFLSGFIPEIPITNIVCKGAGYGLGFIKKTCNFKNISPEKFDYKIFERSNELHELSDILEKHIFATIHTLQKQGVADAELAKQPVMKALLDLQNQLNEINNVILPYLKYEDLQQIYKNENNLKNNEINFLKESLMKKNLSSELAKLKSKRILIMTNLTLQDSYELIKAKDRLEAVILQNKPSLAIRALLNIEAFPVPIVVAPQIDLAALVYKPIAVYAHNEKKGIIIKPSKFIKSDINETKIFIRGDRLLRELSKHPAITETPDGEHIRILANLGNKNISIVKEMEQSFKNNPDGFGNIYAERFITAGHFSDFLNWPNKKDLEEKLSSSLVHKCFYPLLQQIAARIKAGEPKEKFQCHFRNPNITREQVLSDRDLLLFGLNTEDPGQLFGLDLLAANPEKYAYPFLEPLLLSLKLIQQEFNEEAAPLVSISSPHIRNIEDLKTHDQIVNTALNNLHMQNTGLFRQAVHFGSYLADFVPYKELIDFIFQEKKYKYFIVDTSHWSIEIFQKKHQGGKYNNSELNEMGLELSPDFLRDLYKKLRYIYDINKTKPKNEQLHVILVGNLPKNYPLAALFYAKTISLPRADVSDRRDEILHTPYENDVVYNKKSFNINFLASEDKLRFYDEGKDILGQIAENKQIYADFFKEVSRRINSANKLNEINFEEIILGQKIKTEASFQRLSSKVEETQENGTAAAGLPANLIQLSTTKFIGKYKIKFKTGMHKFPTGQIVRGLYPFINSGLLKATIYRNDDPDNQGDAGAEMDWLIRGLQHNDEFTLEYEILREEKFIGELIKYTLIKISEYFS